MSWGNKGTTCGLALLCLLTKRARFALREEGGGALDPDIELL